MINLIKLAFEHAQALIIGIFLLVVLLTIINPQVMLQGLSTGMGVILAQELWKSFSKYREKITDKVLNGVEQKL
jgi:hypothetical protein